MVESFLLQNMETLRLYVDAEQDPFKILRDLSRKEFSTEVNDSIDYILGPDILKEYKLHLRKIQEAPIPVDVKQALKNYCLIILLAEELESDDNDVAKIYSFLIEIQDQNINKENFYQIALNKSEKVIFGYSELQELVKFVEIVSRLQGDQKINLSNVISLKVSHLVDISNNDIIYIAQKIFELKELNQIDGCSAIVDILALCLINQLSDFKMYSEYPEELQNELTVENCEKIREAIRLARSGALKDHRREQFNDLADFFKVPDLEEYKIEETKARTKHVSDIVEDIQQLIRNLPVKKSSQFRLGKKLHSNEKTGAEVYQCEADFGQVAVKVYNNVKENDFLMNQVKYMIIMADIPNFVDVYGAFQEESKFYLVMELAHETLYLRILSWETNKIDATIREQEAFKVLNDLVRAMWTLNDRNISHKDIKPENIFIFKNNSSGEEIYKIGDLDISCETKKDEIGRTLICSQGRVQGTENFMAPELFIAMRKEISVVDMDYNACDVYSLGLTILRMITSENDHSWNAGINLQSDMDCLIERNIKSKDLKEYLKEMLKVDPKKRPKFRDLVSRLNKSVSTSI